MKTTIFFKTCLLTFTMWAGSTVMAQTHYEFHPNEYTSTDNNRAPQSVFSYTDETFTVNASGQNNVAFKMGGECDNKYFITSDDKWFTVVGSGLKTGTADSYVWWINGWNCGSQVPADFVVSDNGKQIFIWNIRGQEPLFAGFNTGAEQMVLKSEGTGFILAMGLTATGNSGTISDVGYYSDVAIATKYPAVKTTLGLTDEALVGKAVAELNTLIKEAEEALTQRAGTESVQNDLKTAITHAKSVAETLTINNLGDAATEMKALQQALDNYIRATRAFSYVKNGDGITALLDNQSVRICFVNDSVVRVSKWLDNVVVPQSLVVKADNDANVQLDIKEQDGKVVVNSLKARVEYNLREGLVCIYRTNGQQLLTETATIIKPTKDGPNDSFELVQTFRLADDEQIYGLGQIQNGQLNMRGTQLSMIQDNRSIYIPYFYSSRRYGFYWDNYSPTQFSDNQEATMLKSTGDAIDYYVLVGNGSAEVLRSLRHLTGETQLPPLWNFGLYQSKQRYMSAQEVINVVKRYREEKVPLDCVVQDWQYWGGDNMWNAMEFLNPNYSEYQRMIDEVHQMNAKLMISVWANFGPDTKQYKEFGDAGRLIPIQSYPTGQATRPYDVYSKNTRDRFWNYLYNGLMNKDIDALWLDSSEPDDFSNKTTDYDYVTDLDGRTFRSLRNAFPLAHVEGVYDHHLNQTELSNKRVSILTRSAFLGMQRTGAFIWSADITSSWETLARQIPAACNLSVSGMPYWNSDTGAFFIGSYNGGVNNAAWRHLYTRWTQFSAFCPMMRFHGDQTPREIWQFGAKDDAQGDYNNILRYIRLRYRLLPYLYSTAHQVVNNGETFMMSMPVAFEDDAQCCDVKDQYMLGHAFLVAPVVTEQSASRNVYLPTENSLWYDFWTGEVHKGGQSIKRMTPADIMPLYIPAGTILPWGPEVQYSSEKQWDNLEIRVYPGANGSFTLYEDALDGYGYKQGECTEIPFTWDEKSQTLTIGERKGAFPGMLQQRTFRIVRVCTEKGFGDGESTAFDATINYDGTQQKVQLKGKIKTTAMIDVTNQYITNPSFEADGRTLTQQAPTGWTVNSNTAWWGVNQGGGNGDPAATDGQFIFGVWDGSTTLKPVISQTISSLPEGTYRLTVDMQASNRSTTTLRLGKQCLFAGEKEVLFRDQLPTAGVSDTYPMQPLVLDFEILEPQSLNIGVSTCDAPTETWFKIDNFRLYKRAEEEATTTSIREYSSKPHMSQNTIYDMTGRKLSAHAARPGLYIIDGRKVVLK